MPDIESVSEKISFSRGFLVQILILVTTLASSYAVIQSDLKSAVKMGIENKEELRKYQQAIHDVQMNMLSIQDDLKYFRLSYERDANKYIRESNDKR